MSVHPEGSVPLSDLFGDPLNWNRCAGKNPVEGPLYRATNLSANGISLRYLCDSLPRHVARLVEHIRLNRGSPEPFIDEFEQEMELRSLSMGAAAPQVANYFCGRLFPNPESTGILNRSDRQPVTKHAVPDTGSDFKVSTPIPDMLYGYNRQAAFLPHHHDQLSEMGLEMAANTTDLICPFLVVNFYGDGPFGSGSMWATTNECLGGSASCLNLAERLNDRLRECEVGETGVIDNFAFSIAMNGLVAQLYVSWKADEPRYCTANIKSFLLQDPEHYRELRKMVLNILDWGREYRLEEIHSSLEGLLESSDKREADTAMQWG
jgi:hypothetical protein